MLQVSILLVLQDLSISSWVAACVHFKQLQIEIGKHKQSIAWNQKAVRALPVDNTYRLISSLNPEPSVSRHAQAWFELIAWISGKLINVLTRAPNWLLGKTWLLGKNLIIPGSIKKAVLTRLCHGFSQLLFLLPFFTSPLSGRPKRDSPATIQHISCCSPPSPPPPQKKQKQTKTKQNNNNNNRNKQTVTCGIETAAEKKKTDPVHEFSMSHIIKVLSLRGTSLYWHPREKTTQTSRIWRVRQASHWGSLRPFTGVLKRQTRYLIPMICFSRWRNGASTLTFYLYKDGKEYVIRQKPVKETFQVDLNKVCRHRIPYFLE